MLLQMLHTKLSAWATIALHQPTYMVNGEKDLRKEESLAIEDSIK
jgi:hypothetical protein